LHLQGIFTGLCPLASEPKFPYSTGSTERCKVCSLFLNLPCSLNVPLRFAQYPVHVVWSRQDAQHNRFVFARELVCSVALTTDGKKGVRKCAVVFLDVC